MTSSSFLLIAVVSITVVASADGFSLPYLRLSSASVSSRNNVRAHSSSSLSSMKHRDFDGHEMTCSRVVQSRKEFHIILQSTLSTILLSRNTAKAFEGGVGGLGKTKPQTNVQFANPDLIPDVSSISIPGDYNAELLAPDGTPVFLSFYAQWPMLKSQGIESRDLANAEASFVQVAPKPSSYSTSGTLKKPFFIETVFGQTGKFGAYGDPTDVKVSKVDDDLYLVSFTTLTPAMRESDRKSYISTKVVGDGVFMLITGTTLGRFKAQEKVLRKVADSFACVEAPKSSLRR